MAKSVTTDKFRSSHSTYHPALSLFHLAFVSEQVCVIVIIIIIIHHVISQVWCS